MATLHWKEARVWAISWPGAYDDKAQGKFVADSCLLLPGVHEIDDDVWEKAKKVKDVRDRLESGQLVEIQDTRATGKGATVEYGLPKTLTRFTVQDAVDLISGVMDKDVLKAWGKIEKRVAIMDAIKKQMKALESDDEKKEE